MEFLVVRPKVTAEIRSATIVANQNMTTHIANSEEFAPTVPFVIGNVEGSPKDGTFSNRGWTAFSYPILVRLGDVHSVDHYWCDRGGILAAHERCKDYTAVDDLCGRSRVGVRAQEFPRQDFLLFPRAPFPAWARPSFSASTLLGSSNQCRNLRACGSIDSDNYLTLTPQQAQARWNQASS